MFVHGLYPLMPIEYIMTVIESNHKKGNLIKVLISKILKLKKLHEDRLQFEVKLRTCNGINKQTIQIQ
jgi:hypothetical protein